MRLRLAFTLGGLVAALAAAPAGPGGLDPHALRRPRVRRRPRTSIEGGRRLFDLDLGESARRVRAQLRLHERQRAGLRGRFRLQPRLLRRRRHASCPDNNLATLMGNLVLNAPIGESGRIYLSVGGGLSASRVNDTNDFFDVDRNDFGVNARRRASSSRSARGSACAATSAISATSATPSRTTSSTWTSAVSTSGEARPACRSLSNQFTHYRTQRPRTAEPPVRPLRLHRVPPPGPIQCRASSAGVPHDLYFEVRAALVGRDVDVPGRGPSRAAVGRGMGRRRRRRACVHQRSQSRPTPSTLKKGRSLFVKHCVTCHGRRRPRRRPQRAAAREAQRLRAPRPLAAGRPGRPHRRRDVLEARQRLAARRHAS